jgi:hypothetical protein
VTQENGMAVEIGSDILGIMGATMARAPRTPGTESIRPPRALEAVAADAAAPRIFSCEH